MVFTSHHTPSPSLIQSAIQTSVFSMCVVVLLSATTAALRRNPVSESGVMPVSKLLLLLKLLTLLTEISLLVGVGQVEAVRMRTYSLHITTYICMYVRCGVLFMCGAFWTKANFNWQPTAVVVAVAQCRRFFFLFLLLLLILCCMVAASLSSFKIYRYIRRILYVYGSNVFYVSATRTLTLMYP